MDTVLRLVCHASDCSFLLFSSRGRNAASSFRAVSPLCNSPCWFGPTLLTGWDPTRAFTHTEHHLPPTYWAPHTHKFFLLSATLLVAYRMRGKSLCTPVLVPFAPRLPRTHIPPGLSYTSTLLNTGCAPYCLSLHLPYFSFGFLVMRGLPRCRLPDLPATLPACARLPLLQHFTGAGILDVVQRCGTPRCL